MDVDVGVGMVVGATTYGGYSSIRGRSFCVANITKHAYNTLISDRSVVLAVQMSTWNNPKEAKLQAQLTLF
eukprot:1380894-Amorphochlora_amoeboformis.AAC.1